MVFILLIQVKVDFTILAFNGYHYDFLFCKFRSNMTLQFLRLKATIMVLVQVKDDFSYWGSSFRKKITCSVSKHHILYDFFIVVKNMRILTLNSGPSIKQHCFSNKVQLQIYVNDYSRISISRILDKSNSRCLEQNNRSHPYQFTQNDCSISRTLDVSNRFVGPLKFDISRVNCISLIRF